MKPPLHPYLLGPVYNKGNGFIFKFMINGMIFILKIVNFPIFDGVPHTVMERRKGFSARIWSEPLVEPWWGHSKTGIRHRPTDESVRPGSS